MAREVTDGEGTAWSCVEAYAGLSEDGKSEAARVEGTDRFRVVCTPTGGAQRSRPARLPPTRHRLEIYASAETSRPPASP
jgi:hypothetical protein